MLERLKEKDKNSFVQLPDGSVPSPAQPGARFGKAGSGQGSPGTRNAKPGVSTAEETAKDAAPVGGVKAMIGALRGSNISSSSPRPGGAKEPGSASPPPPPPPPHPHGSRDSNADERRQVRDSVLAKRQSAQRLSTPADGKSLDASALSQQDTPVDASTRRFLDTDDGINLYFFDVPPEAKSDYERRLAGLSGVTLGKERDAFLRTLGASDNQRYFGPNADPGDYMVVGAVTDRPSKAATRPDSARAEPRALAGDLTCSAEGSYERRLAGLSGIIGGKEKDSLLHSIHSHSPMGHKGADRMSIGSDPSLSPSLPHVDRSSHASATPYPLRSSDHRPTTQYGSPPSSSTYVIDGIHRIQDGAYIRRDLAYVPRNKGSDLAYARSPTSVQSRRYPDHSSRYGTRTTSSLFEAESRFNKPPRVEASLAQPLSLAGTPAVPNSSGIDALANIPVFNEGWVTGALDPVRQISCALCSVLIANEDHVIR